MRTMRTRRKFRTLLVVWGLTIGALAGLPDAAAQDPAVPAEDPAEPSVVEETKGIPFGLYVAAFYGQGDADSFDTSLSANSPDITSGSSNQAFNDFEITDTSYGRAVVGWKLPEGKGDFRFVFQGVSESDYRFSSQGRSKEGVATIPSGEETSIPVPFWFVDVVGGRLESVRLLPTWNDGAGDGDGETDFGPCIDIGGGMLQCGEIFYDTTLVGPQDRVTATLPDDLQNRVNTYDIVYGREFGGRRLSSRWWGGMRYFQYEGTMLAGAWLNTDAIGQGFTNGDFLRLLNLRQEASGVGPTGSWEIDFNFFDRAVQLFIRGQAAFMFNTLKMDSGRFFYVVEADGNATRNIRLLKELDKSSWQDKIEVGARLYFKNGLELELGWSRAGYLDIALIPNVLQLNSEEGVEIREPQSGTQDMIVDSIHFGAGFQF